MAPGAIENFGNLQRRQDPSKDFRCDYLFIPSNLWDFL